MVLQQDRKLRKGFLVPQTSLDADEEELWRHIRESCNPERKTGQSGKVKQQESTTREVGF